MLVIPAGPSFARVVKERPDLELYQADKRHPSLIGTYLAAATVYATLTGLSPETNAFSADIDPELAKALRAAAWSATRDYFGNESSTARHRRSIGDLLQAVHGVRELGTNAHFVTIFPLHPRAPSVTQLLPRPPSFRAEVLPRGACPDEIGLFRETPL